MFNVSFKDIFQKERLGTEQEGKEHFQILENKIITCKDKLFGLNIDGLLVFSSSYARETLVKLQKRCLFNEYGDKYFILVYNEFDKDIIYDPSIALEREDILMIATTTLDDARIFDNYRLIGSKKDNLIRTLEAIIKLAPIETGDLARTLNSSLHNISNRVRELEKLRLVKREMVNIKTGGRVAQIFLINKK